VTVARSKKNPAVEAIKKAASLAELKAVIARLEPEDRGDKAVTKAIDAQLKVIAGR
jgi:hypothetical protein